MSVQRRIDLLFGATVRAMALGRAARKAVPVAGVGLVVVVAVHGTLGGLDAAGPGVPSSARAPVVAPALATAVSVAAEQDLVTASGASDTTDMPPGVAEAMALPSFQLASWALAQWVSSPPAPASAAKGETAVAEVRAASAGAVPSEPPRTVSLAKLDREQQNIARFIAGRYRVTLEATTEFVHHAYRTARDVKLDPMLILAVMSVESSFNPLAQSHAGAQGLMQVLTRVHVDKFLPFGGIPSAFDPAANIRVGSAILKEYLNREGSVEGALKSYVGAALMEHDGGYGMKVLNARERIAAAAEGRPIPTELVAAPRRPEARPAAAPATDDGTVMVPVSTIRETAVPLAPEGLFVAPGDSASGSRGDAASQQILPTPGARHVPGAV